MISFPEIAQVNFDNNGRITNLRFIKAVEGVKMKLNCPLVVSGIEECIGIKRGKKSLRMAHFYMFLMHDYLVLNLEEIFSAN